MSIFQGDKNKLKKRGKRKYELGDIPIETRIGEKKIKKVRTMGGNSKEKAMALDKANVLIDGKYNVCEITGLKHNPANKDYTRRNIITRKAVITVKTPEGKEVSAEVKSRPGQVGFVNAVAVE